MRKVGLLYMLTVMSAGALSAAEEAPAVPCEGDGCDAYVPVASHVLQYQDVKAQKRLNGAMGGLAGVLVGEDVAGFPGAIAFGALGAATGWTESNTKRWEEDQKAYEKGYNSGADMFYDPSQRLPLNPHWMQAGPAGEEKK